MKTLYLDCCSGISGDMTLAGLLDLGVPPAVLQQTVDLLGLPLEIGCHEVRKQGIRASQVDIRGLEPQPRERSLPELRRVLAAGNLPPKIGARVEEALLLLAQAEARAHGVPVEQVHFHELGGLDTLVDLAGVFTAVDSLGAEQVVSSPLPLGRGEIRTAHGLIPLPAPATLNLLSGIPTYGVALEAELVTPTGAVLAKTLASCFGEPPAASWAKIGYGAGRSDFPDRPNVLRLWLGESRTAETPPLTWDSDQVLVLETQVDDGNPEFLPYLRQQLEQAGALDITITPTLMKKGRPGQTVTVLAECDRLQAMAEIVFRESSAIGLRWRQENRVKLYRRPLQVETAYGRVSVKISYLLDSSGNEQVFNLAPEYEECAEAASASQTGIKAVYQAALEAARQAIECS